MKCQHSNNKRAFMYYSMWHTESLSMPLESECYWEWESSFPPWSLWSSPAISLIDAYEDLFPERCRGNSAMSRGMWDIPHSSLQCMGHCSLQIAHCVMPGPLPCLKAVIKLFPPLQEAVLCVSLALMVANIWRNQKKSWHWQPWQPNGDIVCHVFLCDCRINENSACIVRAFNVTLSAAQCH